MTDTRWNYRSTVSDPEGRGKCLLIVHAQASSVPSGTPHACHFDFFEENLLLQIFSVSLHLCLF